MGITVGIIIVTYNRCDVTGMMISKGKHVQNGLISAIFRLVNYHNSARCDVFDTLA